MDVQYACKQTVPRDAAAFLRIRPLASLGFKHGNVGLGVGEEVRHNTVLCVDGVLHLYLHAQVCSWSHRRLRKIQALVSACWENHMGGVYYHRITNQICIIKITQFF